MGANIRGGRTGGEPGSAARSWSLPTPTLSLPKGGGAIRGIGEKFAANPVTGTGSMAVPIATSPGRSGFGPDLALSYDSGSGNGPFGFGWSLPLPSITRKTDRGLPQYNDADESDVFILSGAEDLVPVLKPDGTRHDDDTTAAGYTIRRYRPRIEGLFARIERWSRQSDGEVHWRSISRDNILTLYGKDADSRIADPEDPSRIFTWLICETRDDKGSAVLYDYKREDGAGVDLTRACERNRHDRNDARRTANRYLKAIRYGNRRPLLNNAGHRPRFLTDLPAVQMQDPGWMFEVVFDYGEHDASGPKPDDARLWTYRNDPFSSYRPGFEVRTTRVCQRVLMFHHIPDLATGEKGYEGLVRSTDFTYSHEEDPASARNPVYTFLSTVTQTGYRRSAGGYEKRSLPPVEFEYTQPLVQDTVEEVDPASLENLPIGVDGASYQWTDLHGEGIPGILTEQAGAWFYKRNLSPISERPVELAPLERVAARPNLALAGEQAQFMDLAGDGQPDLVVLDGPMPGLYEHDEEEGWQPFRPFTSRLNRDMRDPNLKFVDLDGDGLADVLITEDDAFVWHPSLAEAGFGLARRVAQALDEEKGPRLVFADGTQSIYLADLSGDGLTDLVRIRNGEVSYWPNLGYGRFGAKVTMDHSTQFDNPDQFDHKRIRLADIDGSGTTDIIYLHRDGVRLYFNQSGNSWSEAQQLNVFPRVNNLVSIVPTDLLGNGTACLVWSSPLPGDARRPMRYANLMGGQKPHLLVKAINNLGAETVVQYAPSTKFYLQDKRDGKPWITRLPFPVHVVERVETHDLISRNRFVTRYAYHHGYFDGEEREFRGFGMVEQWDTEAFEDYVVGVQQVEGDQELAPELFQPPVTIRTWYHTGAFPDQPRILHQFRDQYYRKEELITESTLPMGLDAHELRESLRALKGLPLRQEVYSFDGSEREQHPYSVLENNFEIRLLQPRRDQKHAVFLPVGKESVSLNYERNPSDPRAAHSLCLDLDEHGNARKSCSVAYGRTIADPLLPAEVTRDQQKTYITYAETAYTPDIEDANAPDTYRLRVPYESRSYEITGISPTSHLFQFDDIKDKIAGTAEIAYEVVADGLTPQKRLFSHGRTLFLDNSLNSLPLGQWDSLGLGHQSYQLAFTPGITGAHYAGKVTDAEFAAAGYQHFNGDTNWWIPSGTAIYPANPGAHYYLPIGTKDPLGVETIATLDQYDLLVEKVEVKQATWNVATAVNDYRVLGPVMTSDPNKNRSTVEFDALGMVVKTALMGKSASPDGDTLADPTTRMEYELFSWMNNRKPNHVHTFAREQHGAANLRWQESYAYANGSGGVAMVKKQAQPGKAFKVNPDGTKAEVDADPRWVGNGRTTLNNKGKPVKQHEPYFSTTHEYEDEKVLREIGVTPVLYYDAVGRNIRTLFPNGTFTRVEFDPWMQKVFDANDTVKESQWYSEHGSPDPATQPEPLNDPARRAAWLAAKHADTPGAVHFDSLGRPVYAVSDYGGGKTAAVRTESDLTGRVSKMFDQEQREVASGLVGMAGTPIVGESAEKGRRWTFQSVLGDLVKMWDEHGRQFRTEYDILHRPVGTFVQEASQAEILFNYVVYGDRLVNAEEVNLLGTAHQIFDQAGMVRVPELDFKGNPTLVHRVLAKDYKNNLDWSSLAKQVDYAAIQGAANPALEIGETFTASSEYDALNRPTLVTLPDGTVILPTYNEANLLSSLQAQIRQQGNFIEFLKDQSYDARGQRQFARYGNDVFTRYFYDPNTFRLAKLLTYKSGDDPDMEGLQNLRYTYDPVGNITQISDDAQQLHYFNNAVVKPENLYEYDATYQLLRATGREHAGLTNNEIRTQSDLDFVPQLPHSNNAEAMRTYTEEYEYDLLGNIKALRHRFQPQAGLGNGWTQHYRYAYEDDATNRTNRLRATSLSGDTDAGPYSATYDYDTYGNMTRMPHLADMDWNFMDQLQQVDLGGGGTAHYVYGLGGQRLRKVIERNGNLKLEWIFLGAVMIFRRRRRDTNELRFERWTVHISDNTGRLAQIDTKSRDDDNSDPANPLNTALIRYQYANHLGSAVLETDATGSPISYEEYQPYGTTVYRSAKPGFGLSLKRYRFSGKERDDETGLYYFGARYYAAWLGRWTSSDPGGLVRGPNVFRYCANSPIIFHDPNGLEDKPLNQVGQVTNWTKGTEWVYTKNGVQLSDEAIRQNFAKYADTHGQKFTPGTLTYEWVDRGGKSVPVFNAEWLDKTGKPLLPREGDFGYVAPMNKQEPANYGVPGDRKTILDENEHTSPNAQNKVVEPGYGNKEYRGDATVKSPRGVSLDKTKVDNASSKALQQKAASGQPINVTEEIDMPSNTNFQRANDAAKAAGRPSINNPGSINRGTLEQMGGRFERGKGTSLPAPSAGGGAGNFARNFGGSFARTFIPGFVEAEMAAVAAPYVVGSLGITNATVTGLAATLAAAPAAAASVVVASAAGGYLVGGAVGHAVEDATGSKAAGVASGTLAGAATGAAIGAAIGLIFGGIGAVPGAIVGGIIGGIAGFIGSFW
jgi:RHS repeat-associated protein